MTYTTSRSGASPEAIDPLASVIADLARIERLRGVLKADNTREALEAANGPEAPQLDKDLREQRTALAILASHLEATSPQGALVQILTALHVHFSALYDDLPDSFLASRQGETFLANLDRLERCLFSAAWAFREGLGPDLELLRDRMAPAQENPLRTLRELAPRAA